MAVHAVVVTNVTMINTLYSIEKLTAAMANRQPVKNQLQLIQMTQQKIIKPDVSQLN
jgi:hypothetical protein